MKENLVEGKIIFGEFNTSLCLIKRTRNHNINKNVEELNKTIDQHELSDIYRMFNLTTAEYTFFSSMWILFKCMRGAFTKIDYILRHETNLKTLKELKSNRYLLSQQN